MATTARFGCVGPKATLKLHKLAILRLDKIYQTRKLSLRSGQRALPAELYNLHFVPSLRRIAGDGLPFSV